MIAVGFIKDQSGSQSGRAHGWLLSMQLGDTHELAGTVAKQAAASTILASTITRRSGCCVSLILLEVIRDTQLCIQALAAGAGIPPLPGAGDAAGSTAFSVQTDPIRARLYPP
jgi:hypothetical protein